MKECTMCGEAKPLDAFRRGQGYKDGIRSNCKACEAERLRRWRKSHPAKARAQWTRRNAKARNEGLGYYDPEKRAIIDMQRRDAYLKRKYGISLDEYIVMRDAQGGVCKICGSKPTSTVGGGTHPELVVDHCHTSGRVRALLCNGCNVAIAHAREDPEVLTAMIAYLTTVVTDR